MCGIKPTYKPTFKGETAMVDRLFEINKKTFIEELENPTSTSEITHHILRYTFVATDDLGKLRWVDAEYFKRLEERECDT
jgi:hypothetical protein